MTRKKAFWLSFACTLGVLIPIYAAALFFGTAHLGSPEAAVAGEGVGIAVRRPDAGDSKNLLLAVGEGENVTFSLVRFDALQGKVCVMPVPSATRVETEAGKPSTVARQYAYAGPGLAAQQLAALLGVRVDHYFSITRDGLVALGEKMGNISLDLTQPELQKIGGLPMGSGSGGKTVLSATSAAELIRGADAGEEALAPLRAEAYSAFLLAGMDRLNTILPDFLRSNDKSFSTSILATDIYDYQRILDYLALQQPEMRWGVLKTEPVPGEESAVQVTEAGREQAVELFS